MEKLAPDDTIDVTIAHFELWLKTARPGDKFEYHRGFLAYDRETVTMMPQGYYAHVFHEPMHDVGLAAYGAYERGQVELVQKKIGRERYRYFAIKRRGDGNAKRRIFHDNQHGRGPRGQDGRGNRQHNPHDLPVGV